LQPLDDPGYGFAPGLNVTTGDPSEILLSLLFTWIYRGREYHRKEREVFREGWSEYKCTNHFSDCRPSFSGLFFAESIQLGCRGNCSSVPTTVSTGFTVIAAEF
jgi:hypothetical protein